jgi:hypothetical protein
MSYNAKVYWKSKAFLVNLHNDGRMLGYLIADALSDFHIYPNLLSRNPLVHRELLRTLLRNPAYWSHLYMGNEGEEFVPIELQPRIKALLEGIFPYKLNETETHLPVRFRSTLPHEVKATKTYVSSASNFMEPVQFDDSLDGRDAAVHIISLGCDSVCVVGVEEKLVAIRLKSGDVMRFTGPSLKAWYGVAKVFEDTSPDLNPDDRLWSETAKDLQSQDIEAYIKGKKIDMIVTGAS